MGCVRHLRIDALDVQHREEGLVRVDPPCGYHLKSAGTERHVVTPSRSVQYAVTRGHQKEQRNSVTVVE